MIRPSAVSARAVVAVIWTVFFLANLAVALSLHLSHAIGDDNFDALTTQLNSSYVTYLAAIVGFYLITYPAKPKNVANSSVANSGSFIVAVIASLLWNGVLSAFVWPLAFGHGTVEDAVKYIGHFAPLFSWVVAPIFTVFFAKNATE